MRAKKQREATPVRFRLWLEYALVTAGCLCVALSFNLLLNPNRIASGGVSGISVILRYAFGVEPAVVQWALNIPLFIAGVALLGRKFGVKTAYGSVVLPLFVYLSRNLEPLTLNPLLAAAFGGAGVGLGLGLVFRGRGSTGGMDVAAQILHKYTGLRYGLAIAAMDGLVIVTAGFVFSPEQAMYALIGLFVTSRTIDAVQLLGGTSAKVAFIISRETDRLSEAVLRDLDRGLTRLLGVGGYTGEERAVLMVVVSVTEVVKLKTLVKRIDPQAFVILSDTTEVLGEGFKLQA
ncbi:YitT family protein [Paenibacillus thermoaerophilus]|uniref:YitT family protein n=1 Tax=Paenibacillus thermoaerophilus TaxID=1215385 RepID=A0ABW2V5Q4_9BACL|nr:YitT family protein [Paenibacillus thermoaerophilus]TMV09211.1 YitT family protein [Paenibacillus thermoaerophilus]